MPFTDGSRYCLGAKRHPNLLYDSEDFEAAAEEAMYGELVYVTGVGMVSVGDFAADPFELLASGADLSADVGGDFLETTLTAVPETFGLEIELEVEDEAPVGTPDDAVLDRFDARLGGHVQGFARPTPRFRDLVRDLQQTPPEILIAAA